MCSTALESRITASLASSLRRVNPIAPSAATEILAPAMAAMTSITTVSAFAYRLWIIPKEGRFDLHRTAQKPAVTVLQNRIDRVLDDHWIRSCRLRRVPGVHLLVDGRQGFLLIDELIGVSVPWSGGKQGDHREVNVWPQRFPGLMA